MSYQKSYEFEFLFGFLAKKNATRKCCGKMSDPVILFSYGIMK